VGVERELLGNFETEPSLSVFAPERPDREMDYFALRCPCGVEVFRLTGWPRIISGRGGFFWRSMTRVWREARLPILDAELIASPFWLPISTCCHGCGREEKLFDGERVVGRMAPGERAEPKESVRCRICRRTPVELVVGVTRDVALGERAGSSSAVEVVLHCHSCHRQARIAWSNSRRSKQEIQLDLLYGRR
jgi:hypothetical protein